ncbi:MAG: V-type ATP synthase subunit E [Clostridia bacterium]|nr:V-type ATP synthase subunit E [Clostridia bacterium]
MGELKPIIDAIMSDAASAAEETRKGGEERIERMYAGFEEEKKAARERFEKELSEETDRIYAMERAKNNQLLKTSILAARSAAIKDAIETAKTRIAEMPDKEYCMMLERLYKKNQMGKEGVVYLNERDKKRVDSKIFPGAKIAKECIKASGGFVLSCGKISCDCTLEGLIEERYNEICDNISAIYARM